MRSTPTIRVKAEYLPRAFKFAQKICTGDNQSGIDFGNLNYPRTMWDRIADCFEGKVAELAFQQFAKQRWSLDLYVDFDIYEGKHSHDYGDDVVLLRDGERASAASKIDIKATRPGSQWLLVEEHKFWSQAYVTVRVKLPRDIETNSAHMRDILDAEIVCELVGFAERGTIANEGDGGIEPIFLFRAGDRLFDNRFLRRVRNEHRSNRRYVDACLRNEDLRRIGPPLRAPVNYGVPMIWLSQDWDRLRAMITNE